MILESTFLLTECMASLWNSLPNIVDSEFNCFKSRLDKFWYNQEVLYITGKPILLGPETGV